MKKCYVALLGAFFFVNNSFGFEDNSIAQDIFRNYEEQEEISTPLTGAQRLEYLKKGLWNLMICTVSASAAGVLAYESYVRLYVAESATQKIHKKYDEQGKTKEGSQWDYEYWEAIKEQNTFDLGALIFTTIAGGIVFYNWKQKTVQKTFRLLRKVIE